MLAVNAAAPFSYRLFGFRLASDVEFPELARVEGTDGHDAEIRVGRLQPAGDGGPLPVVTAEGAQFSIPDVARYAVLDGRRIVVDPADGADPKNVRLYLLGSAMGLLLHQRGVLPLHANAVEVGGRAFAFMGPSGAGKSTLAAWFHDHGHRVVADDVCAIQFDGESQPQVSQGLPRLRLWKSAVEASGRAMEGLERSYAGDDDWDKFDVPLANSNETGEPLPLGGVYLLSKGESFGVERLVGVAAAEAVFANTYRGQYLDGPDQARAHWQSCLKLISATPIFALTRTWGFETLGPEAELVVDHAGRVAAGDC